VDESLMDGIGVEIERFCKENLDVRILEVEGAFRKNEI
jgi:hypothetical protein